MLHVNKADISILNKEFQSFQRGIINSKKRNLDDFICRLNQFEKRYKKSRQAENYARNLFSFAEVLSKSGAKDCVGIIYSALMKMPFIQPEVKELYARKALEHEKSRRFDTYTCKDSRFKNFIQKD